MDCSVLVTGAAGFIGRHVVADLLGNDGADRDLSSSVRYERIIAVDTVSADAIAQMFQFSHKVLPLQLDLGTLVDEDDLVTDAMTKLLSTVTSVIHIAGVVDTRETPWVRRRLDRVNVQATAALVRLAQRCGVARFVHVSSAGAKIESKIHPAMRLASNLLRISNSMLSSMNMSTYAQTKRASEQLVLSLAEDMRVAVIRPHVVWGRGDSLSTEIIINWKQSIPDVSIGDPSSPVVSCRVDVVASYINMADKALSREDGVATNKASFDVGDAKTTLADIHNRIAQCRDVKDVSCNDLMHRHISKSCCLRGLKAAEKSVTVFVLGAWLTILMIASLEWLQYICEVLHISFLLSPISNELRLLTPNNYAYSCQTYSTCPNVDSFEGDCERLFCQANGLDETSDTDLEQFRHWKANRLCDHIILSKDWLVKSIEKTLLKSCEFETPMPSTILSSVCSIGPLPMANRIIKAATFECMADMDGVPTDELGRYHARMARGGVGMTVVAYGSVSPDGRSFPTQISLNSGDRLIDQRTESALRKLCADVHAARRGVLVALQLTHAGAFADASVNGQRAAKGPSSILNPLTLKYSESLEGNYDELNRIEKDFANAVDYCRRVGFDAVELHLGHGYLLSQFLSAATNPLHDKDPKARLRFPLRVLKAVCNRAHCEGKRYLAVLVKFNVSELREEHLSLEDARLFARAFIDAGADLLVPSGGHVMTNGLHMLRGGRPLREMALAQQQKLKQWIISIFGKYFVKKEEFREAFFRERVISVMLGAGVSLSKVCLVGGVHELKTADSAVRHDGFQCIQLGRVLLADPDWCLKVGAYNLETSSAGELNEHESDRSFKCRSLIGRPLNVCDNSNKCIVGATMALQPLRCSKYAEIPEW